MSLTLGVLAGILALFPGLVCIAAFNYRVSPGGARRPEMSLTAITALSLGLFVSILVHALALCVASCAISFAVDLGTLTGVNFGPPITNPISAGILAIEGSKLSVSDSLGVGFVLFLEAAAVANFVTNPGFQLAFDRVDFFSQGWVFEHVTRPAANGFTPVGHVFTSTMSGRFAIAYKGPIADIRQDDKGQILAIALSRPERFLYEVGGEAAPTARGGLLSRLWGAPEPEGAPTIAVRHHDKDYTGGIVSLDARVINNIVVHCVSDSLLREIDDAVPDVESGGVDT